MNVSDGVAKFATGAGKPLFNFIRSIGAMGIGNLGKIAGVFGTILRPIGFIFSFKAAYDEFVTSEKGTLLEKSTDAIGTFFGDFIGAPLDLVKSLVARLFGLIGWDAAAKKLTDFSIENMLTEAFQTILDAPRAIITYLGNLFVDENFRAEQLAKLKAEITNWGSSLVGWVGSILPDFSGLTAWVKEQAKQVLPEAAYNWMFPEKTGYSGRGAGGMRGYYNDRKDYMDQQLKAAEMGLNAFAGFDADNSGFLTQKEIVKALGGKRSEEFLQTLMSTGLVDSGRSAEVIARDLMKGMYYDNNSKPVKFGNTGIDIRNLSTPQTGGGTNATVIDNSSRNSSTQNTGLLLNGGPAVDNFTPY